MTGLAWSRFGLRVAVLSASLPRSHFLWFTSNFRHSSEARQIGISIVQRSPFKNFSLIVVGAVAALALAGCGAASPASEPSSADSDATGQIDDKGTGEKTTAEASGADGEAVFSYGDTVYTAQLAFCSLQGGEDALFHGVAYDESGEAVGYLDGDFTTLSDVPYGEARINLGATRNLQSTDTFVSMGGSNHLVVTDHSDTSLILMGGAWQQGGTTLPIATVRVTC